MHETLSEKSTQYKSILYHQCWVHFYDGYKNWFLRWFRTYHCRLRSQLMDCARLWRNLLTRLPNHLMSMWRKALHFEELLDKNLVTIVAHGGWDMIMKLTLCWPELSGLAWASKKFFLSRERIQELKKWLLKHFHETNTRLIISTT